MEDLHEDAVGAAAEEEAEAEEDQEEVQEEERGGLGEDPGVVEVAVEVVAEVDLRGQDSTAHA